jgi:hypothetical protein
MSSERADQSQRMNREVAGIVNLSVSFFSSEDAAVASRHEQARLVPTLKIQRLRTNQ